jgi:catechol 2,3-dioxygenase-like lactoylglutathione lyase family enzyme
VAPTRHPPSFVGAIEIGIGVADLEACTVFYQDVIGLEYLCEMRVESASIRRFAHGDAVIKLWLDDDPAQLANPPHGFSGGATGLRYLAFQVDDVPAVFDRCVAAGVEIPRPLAEFRPGVPYAVVADPEGNWIELTQRRG